MFSHRVKPTVNDRAATIVQDTLTALAGRASIAAYLKETGCEGKPRKAHCCPVAIALMKACQKAGLTGESGAILVGVAGVVVAFWDAPSVRVPIGGRVKEFISEFDQGMYPELVVG